MSRLFLFAIGGTGARVVRSLTMMLASGVDGLDSSTEIVPIIIDYDLSNGDKTRAIRALNQYSRIHQSLYADTASDKQYKDHFFMTTIKPLSQTGVAAGAGGAKLKDFEFNFGPAGFLNTSRKRELKDFEFNFGPAGTSQKFSDYLNKSALNAVPGAKLTEQLLYALYDNSESNCPNAELELDMAKGFKGNPNIGSVVFHDLRESAEFKQFSGTFNDAKDKVFIVSSIFGGTGASGFPEIVNAIHASNLPSMQSPIIGSALVLPYFDLQPYHPEKGDVGAIDAASFNAKTRAALSFYGVPNGINSKVNALYYIGDENHDSYDYNEGEDRQKNAAHVVEFVAASAIIDFLKGNVTYTDHYAYEFSVRDEKKGQSIQLPDFYDSTHTLFLDNLSAFVMAMKYYRDVICGDRDKISDRTAFYSNNRFGLSSKLGKGVYQLLDDFLNVGYNDAGDWAFYPWLKELQEHSHKLYPYVVDKTKKMKEVLSHKTIELPWGKSNPIKDSVISEELNKKSTGLGNYSAQTFFEILRDVMNAKYNQVK